MTKKEITLCADNKCSKAKFCYYHEVDPATLHFQKVKVVDSLHSRGQYECEFFKLYQKVES